jgi:tyrosine-specific transport protein
MKPYSILGGILLITGTTIGAAILAMPITTGFIGFLPSIPLFIACHLLYLASAFCFLDVCLSIPGKTNIISMADKTLGIKGKIFAWIVYLLLLYCIQAAYMDGCSQLFQEFIKAIFNYDISQKFTCVLLPLIFGIFIYSGTQAVDKINRIMMLGLSVSYILLVYYLPQHIETENLLHIDLKPLFFALPVVAVAFGYHIVIPSLVSYCQRNRKDLIKILVIGSFLPLVINVIFQFLAIGVLPIRGELSIISAYLNQEAVTAPIASLINAPLIRFSAKFFTFFAIITSFLGVAMSLSDFLADGLKLGKKPKDKLISLTLTFIPSLALILVVGKSFLTAIQFAGAFAALLMLFLPASMAWNLKGHPFYTSKKGRIILLTLMFFGVLVAILSILQGMGKLEFLIQDYLK